MTSTKMNVPVKLTSGGLRSDPTLSGYDAPVFITRKESTKGDINFLSKNEGKKNVAENNNVATYTQDLSQSVESDINKFISQFDNVKDKSESVKVMTQGADRLSKEAEALEARIREDFHDLVIAKETAIRLNNLLNKYEDRMRNDRLAQLNLPDKVTIRQILEDKIKRELQGFRISPQEYKELDKVNPDDLNTISREIEMKLN